MENKRIIWIDYIKAFACFLVILGHLLMSLRGIKDNSLIEFIIFFIYLFHMPLFICISGILYFKKSRKLSLIEYKKFEIKKFINLVIPYVTFYVIFMILNSIFADSVNNAQGINGWLGILNNPLPPYWFLYALISIFIFVPLLDMIFEGKSIYSFIILLILKILSFFITTKIYFIDSIMKWGIYFYLGRYISVDKKNTSNDKINYIIFVLIYIVLSYILYLNVQKINVIINYLINTIFAILGTIICISIFKNIVHSRILNTYKNYTLQIFLTHTIFAAGVRIILFKIGINSYMIHFVLGIIASIYLPVLMSIISEKIKLTEFFFYPVKTIEYYKKRSK